MVPRGVLLLLLVVAVNSQFHYPYDPYYFHHAFRPFWFPNFDRYNGMIDPPRRPTTPRLPNRYAETTTIPPPALSLDYVPRRPFYAPNPVRYPPVADRFKVTTEAPLQDRFQTTTTTERPGTTRTTPRYDTFPNRFGGGSNPPSSLVLDYEPRRPSFAPGPVNYPSVADRFKVNPVSSLEDLLQTITDNPQHPSVTTTTLSSRFSEASPEHPLGPTAQQTTTEFPTTTTTLPSIGSRDAFRPSFASSIVNYPPVAERFLVSTTARPVGDRFQGTTQPPTTQTPIITSTPQQLQQDIISSGTASPIGFHNRPFFAPRPVNYPPVAERFLTTPASSIDDRFQTTTTTPARTTQQFTTESARAPVPQQNIGSTINRPFFSSRPVSYPPVADRFIPGRLQGVSSRFKPDSSENTDAKPKVEVPGLFHSPSGPLEENDNKLNITTEKSPELPSRFKPETPENTTSVIQKPETPGLFHYPSGPVEENDNTLNITTETNKPESPSLVQKFEVPGLFHYPSGSSEEIDSEPVKLPVLASRFKEDSAEDNAPGYKYEVPGLFHYPSGSSEESGSVEDRFNKSPETTTADNKHETPGLFHYPSGSSEEDESPEKIETTKKPEVTKPAPGLEDSTPSPSQESTAAMTNKTEVAVSGTIKKPEVTRPNIHAPGLEDSTPSPSQESTAATTNKTESAASALEKAKPEVTTSKPEVNKLSATTIQHYEVIHFIDDPKFSSSQVYTPAGTSLLIDRFSEESKATVPPQLILTRPPYRPFYAGSKPVYYPQVADRFTSTSTTSGPTLLEDRFQGTTESPVLHNKPSTTGKPTSVIDLNYKPSRPPFAPNPVNYPQVADRFTTSTTPANLEDRFQGMGTTKSPFQEIDEIAAIDLNDESSRPPIAPNPVKYPSVADRFTTSSTPANLEDRFQGMGTTKSPFQEIDEIAAIDLSFKPSGVPFAPNPVNLGDRFQGTTTTEANHKTICTTPKSEAYPSFLPSKPHYPEVADRFTHSSTSTPTSAELGDRFQESTTAKNDGASQYSTTTEKPDPSLVLNYKPSRPPFAPNPVHYPPVADRFTTSTSTSVELEDRFQETTTKKEPQVSPALPEVDPPQWKPTEKPEASLVLNYKPSRPPFAPNPVHYPQVADRFTTSTTTSVGLEDRFQETTTKKEVSSALPEVDPPQWKPTEKPEASLVLNYKPSRPPFAPNPVHYPPVADRFKPSTEKTLYAPAGTELLLGDQHLPWNWVLFPEEYKIFEDSIKHMRRT